MMSGLCIDPRGSFFLVTISHFLMACKVSTYSGNRDISIGRKERYNIVNRDISITNRDTSINNRDICIFY
jgi:hypothetical protein